MPITIRNTRNGKEKRLGVGFHNHLILQKVGNLEQYTNKRRLFTQNGISGDSFAKYVEKLDLKAGDELVDDAGNKVYIYERNANYYISTLIPEHFNKLYHGSGAEAKDRYMADHFSA